MYRGANAVKYAEEAHRRADQAIKERFELQRAERQSISPYSLSPKRKEEVPDHTPHGPYRSVDDRGAMREVRPKLPHHHRHSDDKVHHNRHVRHGAHADEVLNAFRAAGLAKGISARDFHTGAMPSSSCRCVESTWEVVLPSPNTIYGKV